MNRRKSDRTHNRWNKRNLQKKTIYVLAVVGVLFLFFFPIVPATVSPYLLLPLRNQCTGMVDLAPERVMASISYVAFGLVMTGTTHEGAFGLVYVPNDGWNTVQFPPMGFQTLVCG
jgi:hypothetical protein